MNENKEKNTNFEEKMEKVKEIIQKIENNDDLPLDETIKKCEEGLQTIEELEKLLEDAEKKMTNIINTNKNTENNNE